MHLRKKNCIKNPDTLTNNSSEGWKVGFMIREELHDDDSLAHGLYAQGELLYDVTQIDNDFWKNHQDWHEYFITRIKEAFNMLENDSHAIEIRQEYIDAYQRFLK